MNSFFTQPVVPAISEVKVPALAGEWQLYDHLDGAADAAALLGNTLLVKLTRARLVEDCGLAVASRIRDEMYVEMEKLSRFGANDTEPQCVLVTAIEKAFGLENESLSR